MLDPTTRRKRIGPRSAAAEPGPDGSGSDGTDHSSPRMNASTRRRPSSSGSCTGGLFMRYDDAEMIGPPRPRSLAVFAARMASMMMPAELGESHTSSLYSRFSG